MINPENLQHPMHLAELQEFLLFSVCVAGHNAKSTARSLDAALRALGWRGEHELPLEVVKHHALLGTNIETVLKMSGLGCYKARAKTFRHLAYSSLDLFSCTVKDLERIWGIGPKTSRFFIMYTRPDEANNYAVLDVHVLRWMREECGVYTPEQTPSRTSEYQKIEEQFIELARARGTTPRELDGYIWKGAQYA